MIVFTIIGVVVVACLLISYFNSKTLSYEQKTTVLGLIIAAYETTNTGDFTTALKHIDRALNIDPYNEHLRAMKNAVIGASKTKKKITDTYVAMITENVAQKYRL